MQAIPVVRTGLSSTTSATSLSPMTTSPIQTLRFAGIRKKLVFQSNMSAGNKPKSKVKILHRILENKSHQKTASFGHWVSKIRVFAPQCQNNKPFFDWLAYLIIASSLCRAECSSHGGTLASIHSKEENYFLSSLLRPHGQFGALTFIGINLLSLDFLHPMSVAPLLCVALLK